MRTLRASALWFLVVCSVLVLQSCTAGGGPRTLESVTISPGAANAPNPTNGQVQYVATGHYSAAPFTVTPLAATWGVAQSPQKAAGITQSGMATCNQGVAETVTVEAWVQEQPPMCNSIDGAGRPGCGNIGGSAELTCP